MRRIQLPAPVQVTHPAATPPAPVALAPMVHEPVQDAARADEPPAGPTADAAVPVDEIIAPVATPTPAPAVATPAPVPAPPDGGPVTLAAPAPAPVAPEAVTAQTPAMDEGPAGNPAAARTVRRLTQGDSVVVRLHTREESQYDEVVDERGCVTLPYIGSIRITGMTTAEAEDRIKDAYVSGGIFRATLNVTVIAAERTFLIRGAVMRTGPFPLRPGMTLKQAIATAGGPNEFGDEKRIKIYRADTDTTEEANLEKIKEGKAPDPVIRPGDIVEVPKKWL